MDANFFYYSIYDRFIQRQPCACVHACVHFLTFSLKKKNNFTSETIDWTLPNFIVVFLR